MIDLKKIITQLDANTFSDLERAFVKTKAGNSLFLLQSYRNGNPKDEEIISHLEINPTSLYTLKSRLYDKIQNQLSSATTLTEEELLKQVNLIHQVCYTNSKEISVAMLTKLEENLLANDMHGELLVVYSALKQIHLFSEKYYHYSQLYNKQIAYKLTIEKALEILGNFNRILMQYDFSKSNSDLETLVFLHKGIQEQYSLNNSRQIELIKNIIEIELALYANYTNANKVSDPLELLKRSVSIIEQLPQYKEQKQWMPLIHFLYFEYFNAQNDNKNALQYFEKVNEDISALPFYSNISPVLKFLISKINFLTKSGDTNLADLPQFDGDVIDSKNMHSKVIVDIYNAMVLYYNGKLKEAISVLNNLLNNISVKDLDSVNVNIKITLAYFYIKKKEFDLAETVLKSVSRKLKSEGSEQFAYINNLIKLLLLEADSNGKRVKDAQSDLLTLYLSKNNSFRILEHLNHELIKQYSV